MCKAPIRTDPEAPALYAWGCLTESLCIRIIAQVLVIVCISKIPFSSEFISKLLRSFCFPKIQILGSSHLDFKNFPREISQNPVSVQPPRINHRPMPLGVVCLLQKSKSNGEHVAIECDCISLDFPINPKLIELGRHVLLAELTLVTYFSIFTINWIN